MIKRKTSMTSFDVSAVVEELRERVLGTRLYNIYAYEKGFLFRFKSPGKDVRVVIVPGERLHITRYDVSEKGMPPPLVMGLRKYLRGGVLEEVIQPRFDRIVEMRLRRGSDVFYVVAELLPRGVVALLDSKRVIIQSSSHLRLRDREVRRGVAYSLPPGSSIHPLELDAGVVKGLLGGQDCEPVRNLVRGLGYPGEVVEEALLRLGLRPGEVGCEKVLGYAEELVGVIKEVYGECLRHRGYLVLSEDGPVTVTAFRPQGLIEGYGFTVREYDEFSRALDEYFVEALRGWEELRKVSEIESERARLISSIERAKNTLRELSEKATRLERRAQVIAENMAQVYEALDCVKRIRERSGWEYVPGNCPGVVDVKPGEGRVVLNIQGELVDVDIRKDPSQLIVELYRRIGEIRAKIERGEKALVELEEKLRSLEKSQRSLRMRARARIRRREWYERYHWLVTSSGYLAIGGRDADQNESIVKRYLNEKRIFMHADIHGAPAVVVFNEGEEPPSQDLAEAALLTAAYSKAWKSGVLSVDVYWVWGSQVSKSPPPGEYISKGAFMVYGRRNYIRGVELRLAIGVGVEDDYPVVVVGPEALVKRRSVVYAVVIPGDEDPSQLAKKIKKTMYGRVSGDYSDIVSALSVDEIRERLPGRSRLLGIHRGEAVEPPRPIKRIHGEEA